MSRAHAIAPMVGADAPYRVSMQSASAAGPKTTHRALRPTTSPYLERAMLLWPRLDRSKIRKVADDPIKIAEIVRRRTSQPFDVILAMLTKQIEAVAVRAEAPNSFQSSYSESSRVSLRIVSREEGETIQVQDLLPA